MGRREAYPVRVNFGAYEVTKEIGSGASSVVLEARAPGGHLVAIKVLRDSRQEAWARFERELYLQAELAQVGGFVPVLDAGLGSDGPYLVMPLFRGGTLRDRLRSSPAAWSAGEVVELGGALAEAIGRAHRTGLVHRDLKPENVLFDHVGRPLIADLGLAKGAEGSRADSACGLSQTGELRGTLGYIAPEQLRDSKHAGPAADVFSLGAILYECASGVPAFCGEPLEVLDKIRDARFPPLRKHRADLPRPLCDLIESCLALEPQRRPSDGVELADRLEELTRPSAGRSRPFFLAAVGGAIAVVSALGGMFLVSSGADPEGARASAPETAALGPAISAAASSGPYPRREPATPEPASEASLPPSPRPSEGWPKPPRVTPAVEPPPGKKLPAVRGAEALASDLAWVLPELQLRDCRDGGERTSNREIRRVWLALGGKVACALDAGGQFRIYSFPDFRLRGVIDTILRPEAEPRPLRPRQLAELDEQLRWLLIDHPEGAVVMSLTGKRNLVLKAFSVPRAAAFVAGHAVALANDDSVSLVDLKTRAQIADLAHEAQVVSLASSGSNLLVGLANQEVRCWTINPTGAEEKAEYRGVLSKGEAVLGLVASPTPSRWAIIGPDYVTLFRSDSGNAKTRLVYEGKGVPTSVRFAEGADVLVVVWRTHVARVRVADNKVLSSQRLAEGGLGATDVARDGRRVLFAAPTDPQNLRVIDVVAKSLSPSPEALGGRVQGLAPAPGGWVAADRAGRVFRQSGGRVAWRRHLKPARGLGVFKGEVWLGMPKTGGTMLTLDKGNISRQNRASVVSPAPGQGLLWTGSLTGRLDRMALKGSKVFLGVHGKRSILGLVALRTGALSWAAGEEELRWTGESSRSQIPVSASEVTCAAALGEDRVLIGTRAGTLGVYSLPGGALVSKVEADPFGVTTVFVDLAGNRVFSSGGTRRLVLWRWDGSSLHEVRSRHLRKTRDEVCLAVPGESPGGVLIGTTRGGVAAGSWRSH